MNQNGITNIIMNRIRKFFFLAILLFFSFITMSFVVEVTNIPQSMIGSPLTLVSKLSNSTLDSVTISGSQAQLNYNLDHAELCNVSYSFDVEGGVLTYHIPVFLEKDNVKIVLTNYDKGLSEVSGGELNEKFQVIKSQLNDLNAITPDSVRRKKLVEYLMDQALENKSNPLGVFLTSSLSHSVAPRAWLDLYSVLSSDIALYPQLVKEANRIKTVLQTEEGNAYKELSCINSEGSSVRLSDYFGKGKYILVDFWASWCGPCRKMAKEKLLPLYEKYKDNDRFMIIGIMTSDTKENYLKSINQSNYPWMQFFDYDNRASSTYGFNAIPFVVLFSPDGKILQRNLSGDEIEKAVSRALENR